MEDSRTTGEGRLLGLLHELEQRLSIASLEELIRLVASPHFERVTDLDIRRVGEYDCIEIEDVSYFERAFSPGKEAASALALAQWIGPERVLEDLRRLHASLAAAIAA